MEALPFGKLPRHKERNFVPHEANLGSWEEIEPLFDGLEQRITRAAQADEVEAWLLDWSELNAALDEEGARRYIAMTCNTEDAGIERAYLDFVEQIEPRVKPRQFELTRRFTGHPAAASLPKKRYEVLLRDGRVQVELFRPENVPLETEEAKLAQKYQKLTGSLTVQFEGREQTLPQMARYLERTDRDVRRGAWELIVKRRLAEAEQFESIYDDLVKVRHSIALNAGFPDYQAYMFRKLGRFDYTPADCAAFHDAVETEVMPLVRELQRERRARLGVPALRPWDLEVDTAGRPPLKPFQDVAELTSKTRVIFDMLDPELGREFREMDERKLLDLANRKGKAPGGYQSTLAEARVPFIFMNAVGLQRDVDTILHEAGHAFHALAVRDEDMHPYRNPPTEFCEVASMSMELVAADYLEEFYAPEEANRARRIHLEGILNVLPWICRVDAFQTWVYTHPKHTREERARAWLELAERFEGDVDWSGFERAKALLWHRQLHVFTNAFYYIEYGIAQLGALQVWANWRRDRASALACYKAGLALGASRPLPELFEATGCKLRFDRQTMAPLVALIREELNRLPTPQAMPAA